LEPADTYAAPKLPFEQHAMLLHSEDEGAENEAATKYVNEALSREHLTVYAPINTDNDDTAHIAELTSQIVNYESHVNRGNLFTFNTRSLYNHMLAGNMEPFEEFKILIEEAIKERIEFGRNDEIIFVSGIAGVLARNQKFEESINAEKWWQKTHSEWLHKGLKVTMICSHPSTIFDIKSQQEFMRYKQAMSSVHEIVMDHSFL
jgi:hypothetical protein